MSQFRSIVVFSVIVFAAMPAIAASVTHVTKQQIFQKIIGKNLKANRMGMPVQILYKRDRTLTVKLPFMSGSGTWRFSGSGICVVMKSGPRRGKTCITFQHLGENKYRNSEGVSFTIQK